MIARPLGCWSRLGTSQRSPVSSTFPLTARSAACRSRCSSESNPQQSELSTQTWPCNLLLNFVPARIPMTANPVTSRVARQVENSSTEIACHFAAVPMLRPGRRSGAQNSAYQPPAAPLSCAVFARNADIRGFTSAPWAHYVSMKAYHDRPFTLGIIIFFTRIV